MGTEILSPIIPLNTQWTPYVIKRSGPNEVVPSGLENDTAWKTSVWWEFFRGTGWITVRYILNPINIAEIKNANSATIVKIANASIKCANEYGGVEVYTTANCTIKADGTPILTNQPLNATGMEFSLNTLNVSGIDVTNTNELEVEIYIDINTGEINGWENWWFGSFSISFSVETPLTYNDVYVNCAMADELDNISVRINNMTNLTNFSGRAGPWRLPSANYTAYANVSRPSGYYTGKVTFVVPYGAEPLITLTTPNIWDDLMQWMWVPILVGGLLVGFYLINSLKKKPSNGIKVLKL